MSRAVDKASDVAGLYKAEGIPQTVLIGKDGIVQVVHVGLSPDLKQKLSHELDELLAGKKLAEDGEKAAEKERRRKSPTPSKKCVSIRLSACTCSSRCSACRWRHRSRPTIRAARCRIVGQRGYRLLTTKPFLPPDFDQQVFDELWKTWEEPLCSQAEAASPDERRKLTFDRYGLTDAPGRTDGVAWQYVDDGQGGWVMNCLACHGGKVAGRVIPGVPNSLYDLQTLTEDARATKLRLKKKLGHMDKGSLAMPLSGSIGTTNAVMFGKLLLAYRDEELNVLRQSPPAKLTHHDCDAPAGGT